MIRRSITILQILAGAAILTTGCGSRETQLLPAEQDGIFHTSWAKAEQVAQADGKHILLELWRPG